MFAGKVGAYLRQYYKKIGVTYATSGIFPYGFDWGYADSDAITLKKVL